MSKLVSTAEAARRLGISVATLNRWAKNGAIPVAVQAPGRTGVRFYDEDEIATRENGDALDDLD